MTETCYYSSNKPHMIISYIRLLMPFAVAIFCRLEIEGSGKTWRQDQRIRLQHIDTGGYLHSHDRKYSRIAGGQQEVMACILREEKKFRL